MEPPRPVLLTFDIFGTVIDWRRGLTEALAAVGVSPPGPAWFDAVVDAQGRLEQARPARSYRSIVADSLREILALDAARADAVAATVGDWPPFADAPAALARLAAVAPLVAVTNSDADQGERVRAALGVPWAHWLCAGTTGLYKPDPRAWDACAARTGVAGGPAWWHVSAYADYDLDEATRRGLTTVLVTRPHHRPARADVTVPDLAALADLLVPRA